MIPKGLKRKHFLMAAKEIQRDGVPIPRESHRYDLVINGKKYPPKYVISIGNKYLNGDEWSSRKFNAVEAKDYFIRRGYKILDGGKLRIKFKIQTENSESKYPEGAEKYKLHRRLERDPNIGKKAKQIRFSESGELRCDVCNFSFSENYGEIGIGFIEAHHTVPVSKLKGERKTRIDEIALVCSNCHRMLHSGKKLISIDELQNIIDSNQ